MAGLVESVASFNSGGVAMGKRSKSSLYEASSASYRDYMQSYTCLHLLRGSRRAPLCTDDACTRAVSSSLQRGRTLGVFFQVSSAEETLDTRVSSRPSRRLAYTPISAEMYY